jgi:hypothetical protein
MSTEASTTGETSADAFVWRGGDSAISHLRKIDGGASGEVHEVLPSLLKVLNVLQMKVKETGQVRLPYH